MSWWRRWGSCCGRCRRTPRTRAPSGRSASASSTPCSWTRAGRSAAARCCWMPPSSSPRSPTGTMVNAKKLEKAEARLKAKQDKRMERDSLKTSGPLVLEEASASQAASKKETRMESSGKNKSYDVRIENFDVSFGERVLLAGADLNLAFGRRYGLVGRNGLGKTTLLKMIASRSLRIPSHISILHVEQEVAGDETPALQSVLECDTTRESLLQEERALTAKINAGRGEGTEGARLSEIYTKLEEIEADKAPARASVILAGLGFNAKMQQQTTKEFSGGWRMRLALARALFARPDLLLLDEPTNMLDVRAILWLETYLQTWQSTILVVSHDRNFLNAVATDIIHLHSQRLDTYRGDFENFMKIKEERLKNQQREYEAQQQYREHIQVFIDRFRYNANRASQVQSKLKLLEKLPELKPVDKESEVIMKFPDGFEKFSPPILQLDEVDFYYDPSHYIFRALSVSADLESRICVVGENGAGKSTMLKILMGELAPVRGIRHAHRNLKIGYFSQHHVDQLDLNISAVELLARKFPGKTEEEYRHHLGSYGVSGELAVRPVASLSGGQKSRVAFAQMTMSCPNFYILDEPTNHLDMETIEALAKALNKFRVRPWWGLRLLQCSLWSGFLGLSAVGDTRTPAMASSPRHTLGRVSCVSAVAVGSGGLCHLLALAEGGQEIAEVATAEQRAPCPPSWPVASGMDPVAPGVLCVCPALPRGLSPLPLAQFVADLPRPHLQRPLPAALLVCRGLGWGSFPMK
uniref:ATP-binding cassette sub-family F member 3 n=1 Tax=Calidris pygmaea TaxID=425635 RepID=A0A8C3KLV5_9CHAR